MAYAWMRRDQRRYANAVKFWDTAASSIQAAFGDFQPRIGRRRCRRRRRPRRRRRRACSARFAAAGQPRWRGAQERRAGGGRWACGRACAGSAARARARAGAPRGRGGRTPDRRSTSSTRCPTRCRFGAPSGSRPAARTRPPPRDAAAVRGRRQAVDLLEDLPAPAARGNARGRRGVTRRFNRLCVLMVVHIPKVVFLSQFFFLVKRHRPCAPSGSARRRPPGSTGRRLTPDVAPLAVGVSPPSARVRDKLIPRFPTFLVRRAGTSAPGRRGSRSSRGAGAAPGTPPGGSAAVPRRFRGGSRPGDAFKRVPGDVGPTRRPARVRPAADPRPSFAPAARRRGGFIADTIAPA